MALLCSTFACFARRETLAARSCVEVRSFFVEVARPFNRRQDVLAVTDLA